MHHAILNLCVCFLHLITYLSQVSFLGNEKAKCFKTGVQFFIYVTGVIFYLTSCAGDCLWVVLRCHQNQHSKGPPGQSPGLQGPLPCSMCRGLGMERPLCPPQQSSPPSAPGGQKDKDGYRCYLLQTPKAMFTTVL